MHIKPEIGFYVQNDQRVITTQRISPASAGGGFYLTKQSEYNLRLSGNRFCESPLRVQSRALNHLPRKRRIRRKLRNRIKKDVDDILNCQVEFSDDMIIQREDINDDDGIFQYVDVSGFEAKTDTVYSLVATPWPKIAGYPVDESSAAAYGTDKTAALVLWEITFLGFDNDTIQKKVAGW